MVILMGLFGDMIFMMIGQKKRILMENNKFNYMMLDRLRCDCDYYLNYGGRDEIVHAARRYAEDLALGSAPQLDEESFGN